MNNNQSLIDGLTNLAEFLDANPDFPTLVATGVFWKRFETKDELQSAIRLLGKTEKQYSDITASFRRYFNKKSDVQGIWIDLDISRELVCRKVVKGTKIIPARPATEARVVEDYEWICDEPVLAEPGSLLEQKERIEQC